MLVSQSVHGMGPASIEVLLIKKKPDYNLIKRVLKSITQVYRLIKSCGTI